MHFANKMCYAVRNFEIKPHSFGKTFIELACSVRTGKILVEFIFCFVIIWFLQLVLPKGETRARATRTGCSHRLTSLKVINHCCLWNKQYTKKTCCPWLKAIYHNFGNTENYFGHLLHKRTKITSFCLSMKVWENSKQLWKHFPV